MRRPPRSDTGSTAAELVIVAPVFMAFLIAFATSAQLLLDDQQVGDVARTALEAATDARSPLGAVGASRLTAIASASAEHLECAPLVVTTDTSAFAAGGRVGVTVSCGATLPSAALLGLPATIQISSHAAGVIEPYRAVSP